MAKDETKAKPKVSDIDKIICGVVKVAKKTKVIDKDIVTVMVPIKLTILDRKAIAKAVKEVVTTRQVMVIGNASSLAVGTIRNPLTKAY
jgi:actin-like ATPase involved in cell morphogenesis|tara:strand:- start:2264 stop:2530 length:267 start_codon:yes stop_codon:yes gene_type:complete